MLKSSLMHMWLTRIKGIRKKEIEKGTNAVYKIL